jgi:hypothetical protein
MNTDTRSVVGASVLASAGSLPLHLAPLLVAVLITGGQTTVAGAGLIPSSVLFGQFTMAVLLPLIINTKVTRLATITASIWLILCLLISPFTLPLAWFGVGVCCGLFGYVGTLTAALSSRPSWAFPIRLGTVLCVAGSTVAALRLMPVPSYTMMLVVLIAVFTVLLIIGIVLQQPVQRPPTKLGFDQEQAKYVIMTVIFVLFVVQTGLLAYVVQQATVRGLPLGQALWALALMKVLAGLILLALRSAKIPFSILVVGLAAADVAVYTTSHFIAFVGAMLVLEVSFNLLSAKLQALTATLAPIMAGKWLLAVILLGAATGPYAFGWLL